MSISLSRDMVDICMFPIQSSTFRLTKSIFLLATFLNVLCVLQTATVQETGPTTRSNALIPCTPFQAHHPSPNARVPPTQPSSSPQSATAPATTGITRYSTLQPLWANGSVIYALREATAPWTSKHPLLQGTFVQTLG